MIPLTATLHGVTSNQLLAKMIVVSTFSELTQSYSRILDGFGESTNWISPLKTI